MKWWCVVWNCVNRLIVSSSSFRWYFENVFFLPRECIEFLDFAIFFSSLHRIRSNITPHAYDVDFSSTLREALTLSASCAYRVRVRRVQPEPDSDEAAASVRFSLDDQWDWDCTALHCVLSQLSCLPAQIISMYFTMTHWRAELINN